MLKYETCNRLKDAGFPQDTLMAWCDSPDVWGQAGTPQPNCYPAMVAYEEGFRVIAACPNSDELIGEIERICNEELQLYRYRVRVGDFDWGYRWDATTIYAVNGRTLYESAPTPAEALAELYIAIKESK